MVARAGKIRASVSSELNKLNKLNKEPSGCSRVSASVRSLRSKARRGGSLGGHGGATAARISWWYRRKAEGHRHRFVRGKGAAVVIPCREYSSAFFPDEYSWLPCSVIGHPSVRKTWRCHVCFKERSSGHAGRTWETRRRFMLRVILILPPQRSASCVSGDGVGWRGGGGVRMV